MKKLLILALLLMSPAAFGSVAIVQRSSNSAYAVPGGSATISCALTATGSSGTLVVGVASTSAGSEGGRSIIASSISDSAGNAYTLASGSRSTDSPSHRLGSEIWHKLNASSGVTSITASFSGALSTETYMKFIFCYELSGSGVTFDTAAVVNTGTCSGASVCTGGSVTTATSTGFVLGVISADPVDQNPLSGNEFTAGGDILHEGSAAAASLVSSSAASHQPSWHSTAAAAPFTSSTAAYRQ